MEITIKAEPKEIAALVLEIQKQLEKLKNIGGVSLPQEQYE